MTKSASDGIPVKSTWSLFIFLARETLPKFFRRKINFVNILEIFTFMFPGFYISFLTL